MTKSADRALRVADAVEAWFLAGIIAPAGVAALVLVFYMSTNPLVRAIVGVLFILATLGAATLVINILPRHHVETYRGPDGIIRVPRRRLADVLGFVCVLILAPLVPIAAPILLVCLIYVLAAGGAERTIPLLNGFGFLNLYKTFDNLKTDYALAALLALATISPLFFARRMKENWAALRLREPLTIDGVGITFWTSRRNHLPWDVISGARVWDRTAIVLAGNASLDMLRVRYHRWWPGDYRIEGTETNAILRLDGYPVSSSSLAELIDHNCRRR